jgi:hypothetical protein
MSKKKIKSGMRLFYLHRKEDVSGTSGNGIVAEGVEFTNGQCVLHWLTQFSSIAVYPTIKELTNIHSHDGRTEVKYYE